MGRASWYAHDRAPGQVRLCVSKVKLRASLPKNYGEGDDDARSGCEQVGLSEVTLRRRLKDEASDLEVIPDSSAPILVTTESVERAWWAALAALGRADLLLQTTMRDLAQLRRAYANLVLSTATEI